MGLPVQKTIGGITYAVECVRKRHLRRGVTHVEVNRHNGCLIVYGYRKIRRTGELKKTDEWLLPERADEADVVYETVDGVPRVLVKALSMQPIPKGELP